jgi:hypothetical protein
MSRTATQRLCFALKLQLYQARRREPPCFFRFPQCAKVHSAQGRGVVQMTHLMNTYGRQPVAFTHGKGVRLYDEAGREYLDAMAGVAVNTLGHGHPDLVQAISRQAAEMIHCSNLYRVTAQEKLSDRLADCPVWTRFSSAIPAARLTKLQSSWRDFTGISGALTCRESS